MTEDYNSPTFDTELYNVFSSEYCDSIMDQIVTSFEKLETGID
jgi:hypothetical protein